MRFFLWIIFFITGCSNSNISGTGANVQDKSTIYKAKVSQYSSENGYRANGFATGSEISSLESVIYFEYDSAIVSSDYDELLLGVSTYLINNPQVKIVLEGHTDERGTREYNLALGEERANSVLKQLNILGVSRQQMSSLSFGEENPSALGIENDILALNRRVEIIF